MQLTEEIFIIVACGTLVVQVCILVVLLFQVKKTTEAANKMMNDLNARVGPILTRTQILLDETQPKISALVEDAAQVVYLTRAQAQRFDRVVGEASDRLRGQLVHVDRILTGTLEAVEDAGSQVRRSFWGPVQKASALVQGIKIGLDVLRSRRGSSSRNSEREAAVEEQEDELFI
jgi:ABC-type transporter Mla subunit MlaD